MTVCFPRGLVLAALAARPTLKRRRCLGRRSRCLGSFGRYRSQSLNVFYCFVRILRCWQRSKMPLFPQERPFAGIGTEGERKNNLRGDNGKLCAVLRTFLVLAGKHGGPPIHFGFRCDAPDVIVRLRGQGKGQRRDAFLRPCAVFGFSDRTCCLTWPADATGR